MEKQFHRKYFTYIIQKLLNIYSSKIQHVWRFILDGINHRIDFWDSKLSGKKKLSVDNKLLAYDESGCSQFLCIFKIPPHIFKLKQKLEDKYSLSIDNYKFSALKAEEAKGNLKKLIEESMKNPLDDVDKLLKKQLDKEKKENELKKSTAKTKIIKEIKEKKDSNKDFDFISAKDIKEIKSNLNNNKNSSMNNEIYQKNKNILNNMNVNDFKRNSNMFGLDFFTGDNEKGNNNTNKNSISNNPFNKSVNINNKNNNNLELNNLKNSQNPHNKEVLNRLMNKIVPDKKNDDDNNKELEKLFDDFNGEDVTNNNNNLDSNKNNKGNSLGNQSHNNISNNINKNDDNSNNNNIFNEVNNEFVKINLNNNNNNFNPQNLDDEKRKNTTPFDFDDDDDIL